MRQVLLLCLLILCTTPAAADERLDGITLPPGFHIGIYADGVENARSLALGAEGTVFVGTRTAEKVYALVDEDGDRRADATYVVLEGHHMPNGVAFHQGDLYVATRDRLLRLPDIERRLANPPEPEIVDEGFPSDDHHGWRDLGVGPDGKLYVTVGAPCNVCREHGNIVRMNPDGSEREVFAHGVRNSVGLAWHPSTDVLYFTDNGRDHLGDDLPPDELNRAPRAGMHFGFPYCHGGAIADPDHGAGRGCDAYTPPVQALGPHVAALGLAFYDGAMFPERYRGDIFIAEHGSWNRSERIGYRLTRVSLDDSGAATDYAPFATGWLQGDERRGRPVDVLVMPDGALLVSDDHNGVVYRIHHDGEGSS